VSVEEEEGGTGISGRDGREEHEDKRGIGGEGMGQ